MCKIEYDEQNIEFSWDDRLCFEEIGDNYSFSEKSQANSVPDFKIVANTDDKIPLILNLNVDAIKFSCNTTKIEFLDTFIRNVFVCKSITVPYLIFFY